MRILALVLARGGSKRLPGKNIRMLGGKPLIAWTIDIVKGVSEVCDILVSTDSPEIANICTAAGALVPWLRPQELATDSASSVETALHALDFYEAERGAVDGLLLLQPTSPFRTKETLSSGFELFKNNVKRPVVGVSPATDHPMWTFKIEMEGLVPFVAGDGFCVRAQDLPEAYVINGSFYLIAPADLRRFRSFVVPGATPLLVESPAEALDIDTEWDFKIAESIVERTYGV